MEEPSGDENPPQLMSFSFGGSVNDASYVPNDGPSHHFTMGSGKNENSHNALSLSQWIHTEPTSHDYAKFLEECATFLHKAPVKDIVDDVPSSVDRVHSVIGVSEIPSEILYNSLANACGFKLADSSLIMDAWKEKLSPVLNNNHDSSTNVGCLRCGQNEVTYLNPQNEGGQVNKFTHAEYQICSRDSSSSTKELNEDNFNVSKCNSRAAITPPCFQSRPRSSASRQRASETDRRRRLRISERLEALQVLLPQSEEGGKTSVLDDIIDYIKYLQLQIKELSQSRLGGESASEPFIFLEGYGHYILHNQMLNEPLEEIMGKLLEVNPSEATQLLESRGLYVMPMTLLEGSVQSLPLKWY